MSAIGNRMSQVEKKKSQVANKWSKVGNKRVKIIDREGKIFKIISGHPKPPSNTLYFFLFSIMFPIKVQKKGGKF